MDLGHGVSGKYSASTLQAPALMQAPQSTLLLDYPDLAAVHQDRLDGAVWHAALALDAPAAVYPNLDHPSQYVAPIEYISSTIQ